MKKCSKCGQEKELTGFRKRKAARDGLQSWCKSCQNIANVEWGRRNPDKRRFTVSKSGHKRHRHKTLHRHGITQEYYDLLIQMQGGHCVICNKLPVESFLVVDHDKFCCPGAHSCGKCVRGLLCRKCNAGLGMFNEDCVVVEKALRYLSR